MFSGEPAPRYMFSHSSDSSSISLAMRWRSVGIREPLEGGLESAFLDPRRHAGVQARGAGGVGVDIRGDLEPLGSRRSTRATASSKSGQFF